MSLGLFAVIAAILHSLVILSAIKAIVESRTPQGATAWALGIVPSLISLYRHTGYLGAVNR